MPSLQPTSLALLCLTAFNCGFWSDRIQAQVPDDNTPPLDASTSTAPPSHATIQSLNPNTSFRAADLTPQAFPSFLPPVLSSSAPAPSPDSTSPPPAPPSLNEAAIRNYILGLQLPPASAVGLPIARVQIVLTNPPTDPQTEQTYREQIAAAFAISGGDNFSTLFAESGRDRVQQLPFVATAEYLVFEAETNGQVVIVVGAAIAEQPTQKPTRPSGVFVTGKLQDFPNLYTSDRAKVVGILNGGIANFLNVNTWFGRSDVFTQGNPLALDPAGKGTYNWQDFYVEPGIGGITRLGNMPLYAYGSASFIGAATLTPDLFRSDTRFFARLEKLYGGLLYGYRQDANNRFAIILSGGRQPYGISDGLLFAQQSGAANGDIRAALLSNPRTAFQNTAFAKVRLNNVLLEGFFLDPDELDVLDGGSQFVGANLEYNDNKTLKAGFTYAHATDSRSSYFTPTGETLPRAGLNIFYPRLQINNPFGVTGLWARGEYVHQSNSNFKMSANAWFGWIGYTLPNLPWKPSLSYRYGFFSGDNPQTASFERFDPLFSGGSPDSWIQGPNLVKVYQNSNSISHRIELKVRPAQNYELSLQYIYLFADETNNLGAPLALSFLQSKEIGQELALTQKWNISRKLLFISTASMAFPGAALQRAVSENPSPWFFLQLSLLMFI